MLWDKERRVKTLAKKRKKKINCHATKRRKKTHNQTENGDENLAMINAKNENFVIHRRLMLTVVMKIGDWEDENFTVVNEANGAGETNEEKDEITAIDEAAKEEKKSNNKSKSIFDKNFFNNFNDYDFQLMKLLFRKFWNHDVEISFVKQTIE